MRFLWILLLSAGLYAGDFEEAVENYRQGNYIKALDTFYVLAKEGDPKAQFNVGLIYANGKGVNKDTYQAMGWYKKPPSRTIRRHSTTWRSSLPKGRTARTPRAQKKIVY